MTALRGVYGLPPGADFPRRLVEGLRARLAGAPPEALARVTLHVNTRRMQRRIREILAAEGALLLPRLGLVTDPGLAALPGLAPPVPPLRRRLELMQLVAGLIAADPSLAPRSAAFALADSLAALMDEMQGEGVTPAALAALDTAPHARHWQKSLAFVRLVERYFGDAPPDPQARLRAAVERLAAAWQAAPPAEPVIVAGSTGSRGATARLMAAVAALPQGVLVLPGFDVDMPPHAWDGLADRLTAEDHPQYRYRLLLDRLGLAPGDVRPWVEGAAPDRARNRLISLALRPAPVTDQWLAEGAGLGDLSAATAGLALIEAPTPRAEALAIALRLRRAAEDGVTAALITPDRQLTRRVAAALDRWRILPDDSAGRPLGLTAPGRLLRQIARLRGARVTVEALVSLIKHPLVHSGAGRGEHLRHSRELELHLRRHGPAFPDGAALRALVRGWAQRRDGADPPEASRTPPPPLPAPSSFEKYPRGESPAGRRGAESPPAPPGPVGTHGRLAPPDPPAPSSGRAAPLPAERWGAWLAECLERLAEAPEAPLSRHVAAHRALAEALAAGPAGGSGALWEAAAGAEARAAMDELGREAPHGGTMDAADYAALTDALLARREVREPVAAHPHIRIWGTLEARVQGADLVIAAGLNEGVWPELPPPDPWLNRRMRQEAGLLLPERQIGLAAHDFQQAAGAPEVILSRALRDAEAPTVPSRWLNRLSNLLDGLPAANGPQALAAMRARGASWVAAAAALERPAAPVPRAPRPAPRPPVAARPRRLSVTEIETLIRDPYAVYARHVLRLRPLDPLHPMPDALLRGSVLHKVVERFVRERPDPEMPGAEPAAAARARLIAAAEAVLAAEVPWPAARRLWRARLMRVADWFLAAEAARPGRPALIEGKGAVTLAGPGVTLTARADRIDALPDGRLEILDYKTGKPPSERTERHFSKQLLLEAAMAERGGFAPLGPREVARVAYVGLGLTPEERATDLSPGFLDSVWEELGLLLAAYLAPGQGFASRRAPRNEGDAGDYDHLARFGEWDMSDPPRPEDLDGPDGGDEAGTGQGSAPEAGT